MDENELIVEVYKMLLDDKPNYKGLKFYTLPTTKKVLQVWLLLIDRCLSEVSFHSRICSKHFIKRQKIKDSIPEIFPW